MCIDISFILWYDVVMSSHEISPKILVVGFDRFGYLRQRNKASEVALPAIKSEYGDLVETLVLPTIYGLASELLLDATKEISPSAVAILGVSSWFSKSAKLERQAKNRRVSLVFPDNLGSRNFGRIDPKGAASYPSTLPLESIHARLGESGIGSRLSNDAGVFVCNEVMYTALQSCDAEAPRPTGLIHLGNGMSDQRIIEAGLLITDELLKITC